MTIKYLNENLVYDKFAKYIVDKDFLGDLVYLIERECNVRDIDRVIEKRREAELDSYSYESIGNYIYTFKENFAKLARISPFELDLSGIYSKGAANYLKRTYPYCLFISGNIHVRDLDSALLFYAKNNLGATDEQLDGIIPMLKQIPLYKAPSRRNEVCEFATDFISYKDICGSTVEKYQQTNLYDALVALDDKNVAYFINYMLVNDALYSPNNIINGDKVCCFVDEFSYYVESGNHRMILGRALYEINKYVKGLGSVNFGPIKIQTRKIMK